MTRKLPDELEIRRISDYTPRLNPEDRLYDDGSLIAAAANPVTGSSEPVIQRISSTSCDDRQTNDTWTSQVYCFSKGFVWWAV
jgi:hypothetical protein